MPDLVRVAEWDDTWAAWPADVVRAACVAECGRDMADWCLGEGGPEPGMELSCWTCYVRICCDMPDEEITWLKPEVVG